MCPGLHEDEKNIWVSQQSSFHKEKGRGEEGSGVGKEITSARQIHRHLTAQTELLEG
jgi:hypothetical protein